jgi:hypothetical protein
MKDNVVSLSDRLNERWLNQMRRRQQIREQYYAAKEPVQCKCPKCEKEHETYLQWSGRGIPRVFCPACRPIVSAVSHAALSQFGGASSKSVRRGAYQGFE